MSALRRHALALALLAGFLAVPALSSALEDPFLLVVATRIAIFALAALSLDLILGYGAMVSLGHAAYLGLGAYAVAILSRWGITELWAHLAAASAASALFALVTGMLSLRTRGIYFIMITLAFGQMAYFFFVSLSAYGGDDGMSLAGRSTLFGAAALEDDLTLYLVAVGALALAYLFCAAVVRSRFGRVLTALRENALRTQSMGFSPLPFQLAAFILSGCLAGVAGALLANQAQFVSPAFMNWHRSAELIVMVVLGGTGNLAGAALGAIVALALEEWLAIFSEHWRIVFGAILVLVAIYAPGGLTGWLGRRK